MRKTDIKKTIKFIKNNKNLKLIDNQIKKYWSYHPFTPGHGYIHSLSVAKNAYDLARKNNYEKPIMAFIAGLLHDITRPIENKGGEEKHAERNGKIAKKILLKTNLNKLQIKDIKEAIINHERLFKKNQNSPLSIILYLADKTDMNLKRCLIYGFVSNFNSLREKKKRPYNNLNKAIKDFNKKLLNDKKTLLYIREALPEIKGSATALYKHNMTIEKFTDLFKREKNNYQKYVDIANRLTNRDILENKKILKITGTSPKQINKIIRPFAELLI